MSYFWLFLYGLVAGVLAKALIPGKDEGGLISTTILGVLGSMFGGVVFEFFGFELSKGFSFSGLVPAVAGAIFLLLIWKLSAIKFLNKR